MIDYQLVSMQSDNISFTEFCEIALLGAISEVYGESEASKVRDLVITNIWER